MKEVEGEDLYLQTAGDLLDFLAAVPRKTPVVVKSINGDKEFHDIGLRFKEEKLNRETYRILEIIY